MNRMLSDAKVGESEAVSMPYTVQYLLFIVDLSWEVQRAIFVPQADGPSQEN